MATRTYVRERSIGMVGAVGIGVGAIVGGGILALSGVAFALTGPGAVLAFGLNGVIAIITALAFAELATAFPQSGGPYLFAKRVLSVGAAFGVGWVVWFASIVAAALYAAGFGAFALEGLRSALGDASPAVLSQPWLVTVSAVLGTIAAAAIVIRSAGAGGNLVNVAKVVVFAVIIGGGLVIWLRDQPPALERMTPLLPAGGMGLLQAMGATFIALQGFDLIAAVAGEVKDPKRTLPRAMLLSLAIALAVYLPLLVVVSVVGATDLLSIRDMARERPDTVMATAVGNFLGPFGYWLVVIAGVLSMASALLANLFAASRIAQAMAQDRTLDSRLERIHPTRGTPVVAIVVTAGISALILLIVGDVAAAGAASSLIFLLAFALCHALCLVTRRRKPDHTGFRMPLWPALPFAGVVICSGLAIYQAVMVPAAGAVAAAWLIIGGIAYAIHFGRRAEIFDAANESSDPDLLELRGRSPLVLAPIANPANAATLAQVASCIAPPRVGRVLLLSVVRPPREGDGLEAALADTASALQQSMGTALRAGVRCESLGTVAAEPWAEFARVARSHRCASVLVGMSDLTQDAIRKRVEHFASRVKANVVILRAEAGWSPSAVRRVLVPLGGRSVHDALRARLLAGLDRRSDAGISVTYLLVDARAEDDAHRRRRTEIYRALIKDETTLDSEVRVVASDDVVTAIVDAAADHDLVILGLGKLGNDQRVIGPVAQAVLARSERSVMLVSEAD